MTLSAPGIAHLNLVVSDVARSRDFYARVLGFELAFARDDTAWLRAGCDLLGLSAGEPPADKPGHFGFMVPERDDVDRWAAQLERHGVRPDKGPYDRSDGRSLYFRDPDGYVLEIFWLDATGP